MSNGPKAVTKALRDSFLKNESGLCDGYLHTSDDCIVPVPRAILASRFDFFKQLFYSQSKKDAHQERVEIDATEKVLEYIIDFALTNDCDLLIRGRRNVNQYSKEKETTDNLRPLIVDVISLMTNAHRLEITPLMKRCKLLVTSFMKTVPSICCTILDHVSHLQSLCHTSPEKEIFQSILNSVMYHMMKNPTDSLLMFLEHRIGIVADIEEDVSDIRLRTVADLRSAAIAMIIKQQKLNPQKAFETLYYWATKGVRLTENPKRFQPESFLSEQRWEEATEMVGRIPLSGVSVSFLVKCVGSSKLVASEQMAEFYRAKLLRIEEEKEEQKSRKRKFCSMKRETEAGASQDISSSSESEESAESESSSESESSESSSESEGSESSNNSESSSSSSENDSSASSSDRDSSASSSESDSSASSSDSDSSGSEASSDNTSNSSSDGNSEDEESDSDGTSSEIDLKAKLRLSEKQRLHRTVAE